MSNIVIVGAGILGISTAYFTLHHRKRITPSRSSTKVPLHQVNHANHGLSLREIGAAARRRRCQDFLFEFMMSYQRNTVQQSGHTGGVKR